MEDEHDTDMLSLAGDDIIDDEEEVESDSEEDLEDNGF